MNAKYFSGFCFKNEFDLFNHIYSDFNLNLNEFDVVGFSYGAQKALDFTFYNLKKNKRINRLFLLSPALFNDKSLESKNFIRFQLKSFSMNKHEYINNFLNKCGFDNNSKYIINGNYDELNELLNYDFSKIEYVSCKIKIFIFIGEKDRIINSTKSFLFFKKFGITLFLKDCNHLLKRELNGIK